MSPCMGFYMGHRHNARPAQDPLEPLEEKGEAGASGCWERSRVAQRSTVDRDLLWEFNGERGQERTPRAALAPSGI